jgi:hypothetical protein
VTQFCQPGYEKSKKLATSFKLPAPSIPVHRSSSITNVELDDDDGGADEETEEETDDEVLTIAVVGEVVVVTMLGVDVVGGVEVVDFDIADIAAYPPAAIMIMITTTITIETVLLIACLILDFVEFMEARGLRRNIITLLPYRQNNIFRPTF